MTNPFGPSWKTLVIGFVAAVANYVAALGPNLPTDGYGWQTVFLSAALIALGAAAKDANVSNAPNPVAPAAIPATAAATPNPNVAP